MSALLEPDGLARPSVGEQVVAALSLQPTRRVPEIEPLRLGLLREDVSDQSIVHTLGHVDGSGRVSARSLLSQLRWRADEPMSISWCQNMVVLRRSCGRDRVHNSRFVHIPAAARAATGIKVGEIVLVSALLGHDVLVIHSQASVDEMVLSQVRSLASKP